jgi:hypothetical protein
MFAVFSSFDLIMIFGFNQRFPNYYSEGDFRACGERDVEAIIHDSQAKRRLGPDGKNRYEADDFKYNKDKGYYECPQGKRLAYKRTTEQQGVRGKVYQASPGENLKDS